MWNTIKCDQFNRDCSWVASLLSIFILKSQTFEGYISFWIIFCRKNGTRQIIKRSWEYFKHTLNMFFYLSRTYQIEWGYFWYLAVFQNLTKWQVIQNYFYTLSLSYAAIKNVIKLYCKSTTNRTMENCQEDLICAKYSHPVY